MVTNAEIPQIRADLLAWYHAHRRDLPWRRTRDPYAVWISEIMLQQTRVAAVIPYYAKFLLRFPTVTLLAEAPEPDLLAHWAGLGYYYRARNVHKAAQAICSLGTFPTGYEGIRALPGIGDYTAAAIASISFGLPHAVVDGNVFRVLSRLYNDATNIASGTAKKHFSGLASELLDRERPGEFNQAMMELGATVCLPRNPQCLLCPIAAYCRARANSTQGKLPVKIIAQRTVRETRQLFWIEREGELLVWQRPPDSRLMPGFWELPEPAHLPAATRGPIIASFRHGITFHSYVFELLEATAPADTGACEWVSIRHLPDLPVSTILQKARRAVERHRPKTGTGARVAASGQ